MKLLIACIHSDPVSDEQLAVLLPSVSERVVLELAAYHRVSGLVYERLRQVPLTPQTLMGVLSERYTAAATGHLRMLRALFRLLPELDSTNARWAVVKGPVLVEALYGAEPGRRPYFDLDLLVEPIAFGTFIDALARADARLLDRNWIGMRKAMRGEVHLVHRDGTLIDLHWNLIDMYRGPMRIPATEVLARARRLGIDGRGVPMLDPVDAVLHLAFHAAYSGGDRLLWLKDLERAVATWRPDWNDLVARAHEGHISAAVGLMLSRARNVLGADIPDATVACLLPRGAAAVAKWVDALSPWEYGFGRTAAPTRLFSRTIGYGMPGALRWLVWRSIRNLDPWQQARTSTFADHGSDVERDRFIAEVVKSGETDLTGRARDGMTRPLRVLLVTPRYQPFTGGVETHVREIARRLRQRGVEPTVLTTDPDGTLAPAELTPSFAVLRVPAYPKGTDYYWAPEVYRRVARGEWDVIHCQGIHTFVPVQAMLAAARHRIPFVVTFHTGGHPSPIRSRLRTLQWVLLTPLLRRAARLIAVSEFERRLFGRLPGLASRLTVIPNGADLGLPTTDEVVVDHDLIASVGRLEKYKGHHRAIRALPALMVRRPNIRLRIVGGGQYESALRREAIRWNVADRVEIGPIDAADRHALAELLASAGVVVLLSDYEAHAIAALEALSVGRPVIAVDATGLHDLVAAGLVRGVSPRAGAQDIADAIDAEIDRATQRPERLPTWDQAADRLTTVYRDAART